MKDAVTSSKLDALQALLAMKDLPLTAEYVRGVQVSPAMTIHMNYNSSTQHLRTHLSWEKSPTNVYFKTSVLSPNTVIEVGAIPNFETKLCVNVSVDGVPHPEITIESNGRTAAGPHYHMQQNSCKFFSVNFLRNKAGFSVQSQTRHVGIAEEHTLGLSSHVVSRLLQGVLTMPTQKSMGSESANSIWQTCQAIDKASEAMLRENNNISLRSNDLKMFGDPTIVNYAASELPTFFISSKINLHKAQQWQTTLGELLNTYMPALTTHAPLKETLQSFPEPSQIYCTRIRALLQRRDQTIKRIWAKSSCTCDNLANNRALYLALNVVDCAIQRNMAKVCGVLVSSDGETRNHLMDQFMLRKLFANNARNSTKLSGDTFAIVDETINACDPQHDPVTTASPFKFQLASQLMNHKMRCAVQDTCPPAFPLARKSGDAYSMKTHKTLKQVARDSEEILAAVLDSQNTHVTQRGQLQTLCHMLSQDHKNRILPGVVYHAFLRVISNSIRNGYTTNADTERVIACFDSDIQPFVSTSLYGKYCPTAYHFLYNSSHRTGYNDDAISDFVIEQCLGSV